MYPDGWTRVSPGIEIFQGFCDEHKSWKLRLIEEKHCVHECTVCMPRAEDFARGIFCFIGNCALSQKSAACIASWRWVRTIALGKESWMKDEDYMRLALELAEKGRGFVNPNPMVGAVIVKDGKIIGQGYHRKYGELHAERNALADCTEDPKGAVLYVTLEPCCHYGKTPPCTEAILEAGIRRVVIGAMDANPLVAGKGAALLRERGVLVDTGVLKEECEEQNRVFFHYMNTGTPYVILKYAMTLDGKIATVTGASRWITGEIARAHVHRLRQECMGIMVGSGTVLADDPALNCRIEGGRDPVRIICDTSLRTPLDATVVTTAGTQRTILATSCGDETRQREYLERGCEIIVIPREGEHLDLGALMGELGKRNIDGILLEGGGTLNWSALSAGIVNEVQAYVAPKIFGGAGAKTPVAGPGVFLPEEAVHMRDMKVQKLGEDILVTARVEPGERAVGKWKGGERCSQES